MELVAISSAQPRPLVALYSPEEDTANAAFVRELVCFLFIQADGSD
jgi:hypothetical protein